MAVLQLLMTSLKAEQLRKNKSIEMIGGIKSHPHFINNNRKLILIAE
jgi:hypothetical protein